MNKIIASIGKIVFYAFVLVVGLWTASLTLSEVKQILPGDALTPFFALALFDGGAIAWLFAWTGHARGTAQRSISIIMLVVDLLGVVLLSAARLFTGGQTLADAPELIGAYVIWGIVGATLCNLAAVYAFHIADPDIMAEIEAGLLSDTLRDEAMKQATAQINSEAQALGAILAARATGQLKYNLRLPMSTDESKQVIDAQARDVESKPTQQNIITRFIMTAARKMKRTRPLTTVYQSSIVGPGELVTTKTETPEIKPANPTDAPTV